MPAHSTKKPPAGLLIAKSDQRGREIIVQIAGSGRDLMSDYYSFSSNNVSPGSLPGRITLAGIRFARTNKRSMKKRTLPLVVSTSIICLALIAPLGARAQEDFNWRDHISVVDSSLSQRAIENIEKVDTQMLFHMNRLQDRVQQDLTKFQPVIVAQFTPGGGKFTLLRNEYGNESRVTVEPVPRLFALTKSIAHAPLGIYGSFGAYSRDNEYQGWREPLTDYRGVLADALATIDDIDVDAGFQIDSELKRRLAENLNTTPGKFGGSDIVLTEATVVPHVVDVMRRLLTSAISFIDEKAFTLGPGQSPAQVFQEWSNRTLGDDGTPENALYKLIVQSQVIAATAQDYGISTLIKEWRKTFASEDWENLYVIVEAEWVTRNMNSIAQIILREMAEPGEALDKNLFIVTNLSGVESALHFLARILEDRAAAAMILTDHSQSRDRLMGNVDLLGPVMKDVIHDK